MTVRCGTRYSYMKGCRCFPCRQASYDDLTNRAENGPIRHPAEASAALLEQMAAAGMRPGEISAATGLNRKTCWEIRSGRSQTVNPATAEAIAAAVIEADLEGLRPLPTHVPASPLVDRVMALGVARGGLLNVTDESTAHRLYRARREGRLPFDTADRLCIQLLGIPLELLYDLDTVEAA